MVQLGAIGVGGISRLGRTFASLRRVMEEQQLTLVAKAGLAMVLFISSRPLAKVEKTASRPEKVWAQTTISTKSTGPDK